MIRIQTPAIFLDLQGTLGGQGTDDIRSFAFYSFSIPAVKMINQSGYLCVVITNQSHISRGEITVGEYKQRVCELQEELRNHGAYLDGIYCCPHSQDDNCRCRKPLTGMVDRAIREFNIDIKSSYVVGDMGSTDMLLAYNTGAKGVLVLTGVGKGSLGEYRNLWNQYEPEYIAENVLDAVQWILKQ